jgi:hypothetical protein
MFNTALPVFDSVVDIAAELAPTFVLGKASVAGDSDAPGAGAGVPVPLSDAVCGDPLALSATDSVALYACAAAGENVTVIVQFAPAASVPPQVVVFEKSVVSLSVMPLIFNTALPVFDNVVDTAADVDPTAVLAKLSVVGDSDATGAGAGVPVPLSAAVCGEPAALSATESVALYACAADGENVTEIVQFAPAANVLPQVVVFAKSVVSLSVMPLMFNTALPVFDSVVDSAADVDPTAVLAKLSVVGDSEATGVAATPVPLSATVCGDPVASSATESVAL